LLEGASGAAASGGTVPDGGKMSRKINIKKIIFLAKGILKFSKEIPDFC
jgi:hypothetical protein